MTFPHYSQMNKVSSDRDLESSYDDHVQEMEKRYSSREQIEMEILKATGTLFDFSREESLSSQPDHHTNDNYKMRYQSHSNSYRFDCSTSFPSSSPHYHDTHTTTQETHKFPYDYSPSYTAKHSSLPTRNASLPEASFSITSAPDDGLAQQSKLSSPRLLNTDYPPHRYTNSELKIQNRAEQYSADSKPSTTHKRKSPHFPSPESVIEEDSNRPSQSKATRTSSISTSRSPYYNDNKTATKPKRGRPKRDPKKGWPKRPLSAYNIFFKVEREKLIANRSAMSSDSVQHATTEEICSQGKHGLITFSELGKTIGRKWKSLTDTQKEPYKEVAESYLAQYKKDLEEYQITLNRDAHDDKIQCSINHTLEEETAAATKDKMSPDKAKETKSTFPPIKKRRGRPKRDPKEGWPKRPLSAYNIFFKQEHKRLLNSDPSLKSNLHKDHNTKNSRHDALQGDMCSQTLITNKELVKTIALNWKQLSQENREYYEKAADSYLVEYRKELEIFQEKRQQNSEHKHN